MLRMKHLIIANAAALLLLGCNQAEDPAAALARLAPVATNDIAKDPALLAIAMEQGKVGYDMHCASCHGADLKGSPEQHTPDLTDNFWIYAGDDLDTGGIVHNAADVEKTITNGIRSRPRVTNLANQMENDAHNMPNKTLADMPAMGPQSQYALTPEEMAGSAEYVLKLSGQEHNAEMAARGEAIYADKGSCYDCHGQDGSGDMALGSTNLLKPEFYLYGSTREAILTSIVGGRVGVSPAFEGILKPEEIKAIAVFVFSNGGPGAIPAPP